MSAVPEHEHHTAVGVDDDVELIKRQMTALRELGRRGSVSEDEIYDFSIRWGTVLAGRVRRLAHYSALGLLAEADAAKFHVLREELDELTGLIDRFRLTRPRLAGDDHPRRRHLRRV
jgi:hypothetical protein